MYQRRLSIKLNASHREIFENLASHLICIAISQFPAFSYIECFAIHRLSAHLENKGQSSEIAKANLNKSRRLSSLASRLSRTAATFLRGRAKSTPCLFRVSRQVSNQIARLGSREWFDLNPPSAYADRIWRKDDAKSKRRTFCVSRRNVSLIYTYISRTFFCLRRISGRALRVEIRKVDRIMWKSNNGFMERYIYVLE